jgi:hypothetical protein
MVPDVTAAGQVHAIGPDEQPRADETEAENHPEEALYYARFVIVVGVD